MLKFGVLGYSTKNSAPFLEDYMCLITNYNLYIHGGEGSSGEGALLVDNLSAILGALTVGGGNQLEVVL